MDPQLPVFPKDGHADLERLHLATGVVHHVHGEESLALHQVDRRAGEFFQHAPQLLGRFVALQADEPAFAAIGVPQRKVLLGVVFGEAMQPVSDDEAKRILTFLFLENYFMTVQVPEVIRDPCVVERLPMLHSVNVKCFRQANPSDAVIRIFATLLLDF